MAHYSYAQEPLALAEAAKDLAEDLLDEVGDRKFALVYVGMSGVSFATALALEMQHVRKQFRMIYVRKDREETHGRMIETPHGWDEFHQKHDPVIVFVDDFQDTGHTRCCAMQKLLAAEMVTEDDQTFAVLSGTTTQTGRYSRFNVISDDNFDWTTVGKFKDHFAENA